MGRASGLSVTSARSRFVTVAVALMAVLALSACTEQQIETMDRVNTTRAELGLPQLNPHPAAMIKAQQFAEILAAEGDLRHSELSDGLTDGWIRIGENVGYGADIATIHEAFLESPGHRANIVDDRFNWIGTGYAEHPDGRVFVVQVFVQY